MMNATFLLFGDDTDPVEKIIPWEVQMDFFIKSEHKMHLF